MTQSKVGPLPFVFLLAIATEANGALAAPVVDGNVRLQAGMLSELLRSIEPPGAFGGASEPGARPAQLVQYFPNFPNFRNCMHGTWRNC